MELIANPCHPVRSGRCRSRRHHRREIRPDLPSPPRVDRLLRNDIETSQTLHLTVFDTATGAPTCRSSETAYRRRRILFSHPTRTLSCHRCGPYSDLGRPTGDDNLLKSVAEFTEGFGSCDRSSGARSGHFCSRMVLGLGARGFDRYGSRNERRRARRLYRTYGFDGRGGGACGGAGARDADGRMGQGAREETFRGLDDRV